MKFRLLAISLLTLSACMKKPLPDESLVMQGEPLFLPPNYELIDPANVKTKITVQDKQFNDAKTILLGSNGENISKNEIIKGQKTDQALNLWLLKNAGGQARVANIKDVLNDDQKSIMDN